MKRKLSFFLIVILVLGLCGCGNNAPKSPLTSDQMKEKVVKIDIKKAIEYYDKAMINELPEVAKGKDETAINQKLKAVSTILRAESKKFTQYMKDEKLSKNTKVACEDVQNCFIDVTNDIVTKFVEKSLDKSKPDVDFSKIAVDARKKYLEPALQLIK